MSYQPPPEDDRSVGELVFDVSERVSTLVREEIELAKAEITEKLTKLLRGGVAGIVAGVFAIAGLAMLMHAFAWLLNDLFFDDDVWLGFLIEALFWFVVAAAAGFFAYRSINAGAPPTPDMAIEEGRRIKQTLESGTTLAAKEPQPFESGTAPAAKEPGV
ncbi:MAG TPA: phage holin family protein [Solirubrobacterales bacterium]|nr:phage holin family protein [Solirubrobacterales bacterium]